jgi:sugar phosphate isomerase/epimerase
MGFDSGNKELQQQNQSLVALAQKAADLFDAKTIVVHAGLGHGQQYIDETVRQFRLFNDSRIVVENLPYLDYGTVPMHGSKPEEIKYIMQESGCGFCFDFSHAVCAAVSLNIDVGEYLRKFFDLHPTVYHMCDGDINKADDLHLHFGAGNFPLPHFLNDFTAEDAYITIETSINVEQEAKLKIKDYQYLKSRQNS